MNSMNDSKKNEQLVDMVTLGERGQVVIPQAMREAAGIKPGDKLMVVLKHGQIIGLMPPACFHDMVQELTAQLARAEEKTNDK